MKKYFLVFLLCIQSISYAQYLNVDFVEGELDPTPLVKNMGEPPKGIEEAKVSDNNRSPAKEGASRAPAIIDTLIDDTATKTETK